MYAGPISRLIAELSKLPGIGQRTAQRLAFHILRADDADALALADSIREVKEKVGLCERCFNLAEGPLCRICEDGRRDQSVICVVEQPADVIPIERTGEYRGVYHVLGGALSPIDGIDPEDLRIAELPRAGERRDQARSSSRPTRPPSDGDIADPADAPHRRGLRRDGHASPRQGARAERLRPRRVDSSPTQEANREGLRRNRGAGVLATLALTSVLPQERSDTASGLVPEEAKIEAGQAKKAEKCCVPRLAPARSSG
jgi:recombination protein RecR